MSEPWNGINRRNYLSRIPLRVKMPLLIGIPALFILIGLSFFSYLSADASLNKQQRFAVVQVLDEKALRLETWLKGLSVDIDILTHLDITRSAILEFSAAWEELQTGQKETLQRLYITENPHPTGSKEKLAQADDGSSWSGMHVRYHDDFHAFQTGGNYYDLFLFDLEGNLIYSVFKELDFATNFVNGEYSDSELGKTYRAAMTLPEGDFHLTEFQPYAPSFGAPAKFISMPVFTASGMRIGVVALQVPVDEIATIIAGSELLGETGQIYAVDDHGRALSDSIREGGHKLLDTLPELTQIKAVIQGEETTFPNVTGLSGEQVVAFTHSAEILGHTWHLILEQDVAEAGRIATELFQMALIQSVIVMFLIVALAFMVGRILTKRIDKISNSVKDMSKGDLLENVAEIDAGDELGDIARALDSFRSELADGQTAIKERDVTAGLQMQVIDELNGALAGLASGALDCTLENEFPEAFEGLRQNFNASVNELSRVIIQLKSVAEVINNDASSVSNSSLSLSQRTENQAATLEQTSAAMEQISVRVVNTSKDAQKIVSSIEAVQTHAEHGEQVGDKSFAAMAEIELSAAKISKFVESIDDIAFRTNLLALNAGVEAARAGEAGRGFAVVSNEVRDLSQHVATNAAEIRALIAESGISVQKGVTLAGDMGQAIKKILADVSLVSGNVKSIANSTEKQAESLSEVNAGITVLDRATQENAAMVDVTAASCQQLQKKAGEMNTLVSRFSGTNENSDDQLYTPPKLVQAYN